MLNTQQTEQVADVGATRLTVLKRRGQLPFDDPNPSFGIRKFSALHALALNLQGELCDCFGVGVSQAAEIVIRAMPELVGRWATLTHGDLWIAVQATPKPKTKRVGGHKKTWNIQVHVVSRDQLREMITAAEPGIQRVFPVHATGVFNQMLARAQSKNIALPPVDDLAAWREAV